MIKSVLILFLCFICYGSIFGQAGKVLPRPDVTFGSGAGPRYCDRTAGNDSIDVAVVIRESLASKPSPDVRAV